MHSEASATLLSASELYSTLQLQVMASSPLEVMITFVNYTKIPVECEGIVIMCTQTMGQDWLILITLFGTEALL